MIGIIDVGGANCCSYLAGQKGRNLKFYTDYNFSSRAIGILAWLKTRGSFSDPDYIYGTLSAENGKSPLDYTAMMNSASQLKVVATDCDTAEPVYFDKTAMQQNDYRPVCASSCNPEVCKPYRYQGRRFFDGYVADPLPVEKALEDGCDKLIILLTLPKTHMRSRKACQISCNSGKSSKRSCDL